MFAGLFPASAVKIPGCLWKPDLLPTAESLAEILCQSLIRALSVSLWERFSKMHILSMDGNGTEACLNDKPFSSCSSRFIWFSLLWETTEAFKEGGKADKTDYKNDFFLFCNSSELICALLVRYRYSWGTDVSNELSMCSYSCVRPSERKCGSTGGVWGTLCVMALQSCSCKAPCCSDPSR